MAAVEVLRVKRLRIILLGRVGRFLRAASQILLQMSDGGDLTDEPVEPDQAQEDEHLLPEEWPEEWSQKIASASRVSWFRYSTKTGMNGMVKIPRGRVSNFNDRVFGQKPRVREKQAMASGKTAYGDEAKITPGIGNGDISMSSFPPESDHGEKMPERVFNFKTRLWVEKHDDRDLPGVQEQPRPLVVPISNAHGNTVEPVNPHPDAVQKPLAPQEPAQAEPLEKSVVDKEANPLQASEIDNPVNPGPGVNRIQSFSTGIKVDEEVYSESVESRVVDVKSPGSQTWPQSRVAPVPDLPTMEKGVPSPSWMPFTVSGIPDRQPSETSSAVRYTGVVEPWPELEDFVPHPDNSEVLHQPEFRDRDIRLKHEQKGSLWSVLRF